MAVWSTKMPFSIANWTRCLPPMLTLCFSVCAHQVGARAAPLARSLARAASLDARTTIGQTMMTATRPLQADDDGVRRERLDSRPLDSARGVDGCIASPLERAEGGLGEFCRLAVAALHLA